MENFKNRNDELNQLLEQGKAMEAFERYYAEELIIFQGHPDYDAPKSLHNEIKKMLSSVKYPLLTNKGK